MIPVIKRLKTKSISELYFFLLQKVLSRLRFIKVKWKVFLAGGEISIGKNVKFHHKISFQGKGKVIIKDNVVFGFEMSGSNDNRIILQARNRDSKIFIDENSQIMNGCEFFCTESITIGKNVLIGANVKIMDSNFHELDPLKRHLPGDSKPVIIHDNCWLGIDCLLLKGSEIGVNSVLAAKSVTNSSIIPNSLYGGIPARLIKYL